MDQRWGTRLSSPSLKNGSQPLLVTYICYGLCVSMCSERLALLAQMMTCKGHPICAEPVGAWGMKGSDCPIPWLAGTKYLICRPAAPIFWRSSSGCPSWRVSWVLNALSCAHPAGFSKGRSMDGKGVLYILNQHLSK